MRKMHLRCAAVFMAFLVGASSFTSIPINAAETAVTTEDPQADTDNDGLLDYLEEYFGTDKTKEDTDGDGLSDYWEIAKFKLDPLKSDTDENGTLDGEEDADKDGLSNALEIQLGTNPLKADTDEDGISDGEEVNVYLTSPILRDSDNDGLLDGEEVSLQLSPVKKYTKALEKDNKRLFSQSLKRQNVDESLLDDNDAVPSLTGKMPGLMERNISIANSTIVLEGMDEVLVGKPISIESAYENEISMKLTFTCRNGNKKEMKQYKIGHFENGSIAYLETKVSGKKVSADIKEGGTYFVINTAKLEETQVAVASTMAVTDTDTDYDGISDAVDPKPNDNSFVGIIENSGSDINSRVTYAIDYRSFFNDATVFSSQLCKASCVYANMAYGFTMADEASGGSYSLINLMKYQGLSDVKSYNLSSAYSDYDLIQFYIGHRTVNYNGVTKDIIAVTVRGTSPGIAEWSSNFDIGNTSTYSSYADWTNSLNHKGFDVAATRVLRYISNYISTYTSSSNTKAYWVTGHSRGAAVANILGAKLTDQGNTAYTYTFASPNTTTKSATYAKNYRTIFNVVNTDDFVPCLPCTAWNFRRYGRTYEASIADSYENEWEDLTGISDYNPDTLGMQDTVDELSAVFATRNKAYQYTCPCHGDGSKDDITVRNYGTSKSSREGAIAKIPSNALPYCQITRYNGTAFWGWDFDNCQTPCYFMQVLAAEMAGTINTYRFVVELNVADHYESAKSAIISSAIGGLEHPHYTESYTVLAKHATASNFQ